ncbi:hypothetical protein UlMin_006228 [Ulmus minor]
MGCSASKPGTILTKTSENRSNPSSSSSSSSPTTTSNSISESSNPHPPNPVRRAFSLSTPLVHHPPLRKGDTHHLVSLTSTTYGSLLIDRKSAIDTSLNSRNQIPQRSKSSIQTHPELSLSPDSVINTWELMDGLDDFDLNPSIYDRPISFPTQPSSCRYTCFDGSTKKRLNSFELVKRSESLIEDSSSSSGTKPLWQHLSEESLLSKMDPNVGLTYRRALSSRQLGYKHSKTRSLGASPSNSSISNDFFRLSGTEDKIVIYFTSLRGIRKTYEDCSSVRMIFQGFRVAVDERDISMDSEFKKELQSALRGKMMSLPQVFIRGKYIGGAEEVRKLHENGELGLLLEGFPVMESGFFCHGCGDARFLPCPNCNGSRKVFEEEEGEIRRCSDCNENGLIRCPACCS